MAVGGSTGGMQRLAQPGRTHSMPQSRPRAMEGASSTSHESEPEYTRVEFRSGCGCCSDKRPSAQIGGFVEGGYQAKQLQPFLRPSSADCLTH